MNVTQKINVLERYRCWLGANISDDLRQELLSIAGDKTEIDERFYQYVQFGTGGMRGLLGAGTNRMNVYKRFLRINRKDRFFMYISSAL